MGFLCYNISRRIRIMAKTILKKVPDDDVWYRFDDEVCIFENKDNIVITGNRDFNSYGDETLIKVIKGDYYDEDKDENGEVIGYDYVRNVAPRSSR